MATLEEEEEEGFQFIGEFARNEEGETALSERLKGLEVGGDRVVETRMTGGQVFEEVLGARVKEVWVKLERSLAV